MNAESLIARCAPYFDESPIPCVLAQADQNGFSFVYANGALARLCGAAGAELLETVLPRLLPAGEDRWRAFFGEAARPGGDRRLTVQFPELGVRMALRCHALGDGFCLCVFDPVGAPRFPDRPRGKIHATAMLDLEHDVVLDFRSEDQEARPRFSGGSIEALFAALAASVSEDAEARAYFQAASAHKLLRRAGATGAPVALEYLCRWHEGEEPRWVRYEEHLMNAASGGAPTAFLYLTDIDRERRATQRLEDAAARDSMTGLLNHDTLLRRAGRYLGAEGGGGMHALYFIDLDNFKQINDTFGHQYGDLVLTDVAGAISGAFRASDLVGRVGGDEFMVLMKNADAPGLIARKAAELCQALQFTCTANNQTIHLSASIGVAVWRAGDKTLEQLYAEADSAVYAAKQAGRSRVRISGGGADAAASEESGRGEEGAGPVQLRSLLEYMDGGLVLLEIGAQIRQLYVSPSFCRLLGCDPAAAGSLQSCVRIHPDDQPALAEALRRGVREDAPIDQLFRCSAMGGPWRLMRANAARIPYPASSWPVLVTLVTAAEPNLSRDLVTDRQPDPAL